MSSIIIDRRENPKGKSLANRQRFIRRAKKNIMEQVRKQSSGRSIKEMERGGVINIPAGDITEPWFAQERGSGGFVLPGNKDKIEGDTIGKPPGGGGSGNEGSPDGEGQDEFTFALSREEFIDLFLQDLELPDMVKEKLKSIMTFKVQRSGYTMSGSPANLNLARTFKNSLGRRIALHRPKYHEIQDVILRIEECDDPELRAELELQLETLRAKARKTPYIDPMDARYNNFVQNPKPASQAVMFCLMDVSGSVSEHMKDLSKRFFTLLYLFLTRKYKTIDVVFVRHTHEAMEVDEDEFFHGRETGGTVVSTALKEMNRIIEERYPVEDWNIYAAQSSDGDNYSSDTQETLNVLRHSIMPKVQYYAYIEVSDPDHSWRSESETDLWKTYSQVDGSKVPFVMKKVRHRRDIYPVFRELFTTDEA